MAFYKDVKNKSRQERRADAIARGGFEDEGASYRKGGHSSGRKGAPHADDSRSYGDNARSASRKGAPRTDSNRSYGDNARSASRKGAPRADSNRSYGDNAHGSARDNARNASRKGAPRADSNRSYGDAPRKSPRPAPHGDFTPRSASYKDNAIRQTPHGERPSAPPAPRDGRKAGSYRFADGEPTRYTGRGDRTTPIPYDEQRRMRQQEEHPYEQYRFTPPTPSAPPSAEDEYADTLLSGRNPIREALKSGRDIEKLMVARGELSGSAREIVQMARERHIPVQEVDRARLDAITRNHQGMLAFASAYQYSTVEDMLALAKERGEEPFLVLLDGVTDPHNVGAIIRTAECAGAHGVVVQERRAAGLTPAAVKASAGAVEYIPVARVTNLTSTIEQLKRLNIWVYAADMDGEPYDTADLTGAVALVIGSEGEGVSRLVRQACDKVLSLPIRGKLDSLNASVAAGVLMYAVMRAH